MHAACNKRFAFRQALLATAIGGAVLCGCTEKHEGHAPALAGDLPVKILSRPMSRAAEPAPPSVMVLAHGAGRISPRKPTRKSPIFDPTLLVGLEPPAVDRMLGRPAGTSTDATTVEWIYGTPSCSLSIFFYPDVTTGTLRALKYNVTNRQAAGGCVYFPMMARSDEPS
jgi:hypothetical protein